MRLSPLRNFRICEWTDGDFTFEWLFAPSLQGVFLRTSQQKTRMYDFGEVPFDSVTKYDESVSKPEVVFLKNHVYGIRTPDGHYVKILVKDTEVVKE